MASISADHEAELMDEIQEALSSLEQRKDDLTTDEDLKTYKLLLDSLKECCSNYKISVEKRIAKMKVGGPNHTETIQDLKQKVATWSAKHAILETPWKTKHTESTRAAIEAKRSSYESHYKGLVVESKDCVAKLVEELTALKEDPNSKQIAYFSSFMQDLNEDVRKILAAFENWRMTLEEAEQITACIDHNKTMSEVNKSKRQAASIMANWPQEASPLTPVMPATQGLTGQDIIQAISSGMRDADLSRQASTNPGQSTSFSFGSQPASQSSMAPARPASYNWAKETIPKFSGKSSDFLSFERIFKEGTEGRFPEEMIIRKLNDLTPNEINLLSCESVTEAWEELRLRYANPVAISYDVIFGFIRNTTLHGNDDQRLVQLEDALRGLKKELSAIGSEDQLTGNLFIISCTIRLVPGIFHQQLSQARSKKFPSGIEDAEGLYQCLAKFLKDEKANILRYRKANLDASKKGSAKVSVLQMHPDDNSQEPVTCHACSAVISGTQKPNSNSGKPETEAEKKKRVNEMIRKHQQTNGPCRQCGGHHEYSGPRGRGASTRLADCPSWTKLSLSSRIEALGKIGGCFTCTSWNHKTEDCHIKHMKCGKDNCTGKHHRYLHGSTDSRVSNSVLMTNMFHEENFHSPLLHVIYVPAGCSDFPDSIVFLDDGSEISLTTHDYAAKNDLPSIGHTCWITPAGHKPELHRTRKYFIPLKNADGEVEYLSLIGMDRITDDAPFINGLNAAYKEFPHVPPGSLDRRSGPVDILIGQDNSHLLAYGGEGEDTKGKLRLMKTRVAPQGYVLGGYHPDIIPDKMMFSKEAALMRASSISTYVDGEMPLEATPPLTCANISTIDFLQGESLGVSTPRKCRGCSRCTICSMSEEGRSLQEMNELLLIQAAVKRDPDLNVVVASYPLIGDHELLQDNRAQAEKRAASLWKSLERQGQVDVYNEQWTDYLKRGVIIEVTLEEIEDYKKTGPIHFIGHHAVKNSHSKSTPVRLVADSAMKNNFQGPSLNDILPKGPNALSDLHSVMLRSRTYETRIVFDLEKAYHCIRTGEKEKFLRLTCWKFTKDEPWRYFGYMVAGMGDRISAGLLEQAKILASEAGKEIDEEAAMKLIQDSYVDDIDSGTSQDNVQKLVGDKSVREDGKLEYSGTFSQILKTIGFRPKAIWVSGVDDPEVNSKLGPVLGMDWEPVRDVTIFRHPLNIEGKKGAAKLGPDLTKDDIPKMLTFIYTRRNTLGMMMQLFDPLGFLTPVTCGFKIAVKAGVLTELGWDEPLPETQQNKWKSLIRMTLESDSVEFPRSIRTPGVIGRPELVLFVDASESAFAGVIYIRWRLESGGHHTAFYTSKAKVTPKGLTIPRGELCACLLGVKLVDKVISVMDVSPRRITILSDSTCTIASLDVNSSILQPYFGNRALEINEKITSWGKPSDLDATQEMLSDDDDEEDSEILIDKIHHVEGENNVADLPSRGNCTWADIGPGSLWQTGPEYLSQDRSKWPVTREFSLKIPVEETRKRYLNTVNCTIKALKKPAVEKLVSVMSLSNNLDKVRGIAARLARAGILNDRYSINRPLTPGDFKAADFWLKLLSMRDTLDLLKKAKLDTLSPFWEGGLCWSNGRLSKEASHKILGHEKLLLLSNKSRYAELILIQCHEEDHRASPGDALMRSRRRGVWIVRGRNLAEKISRNCYLCKRHSKKTLVQKMAPLPSIKTDVPCRPWTHLSIDFMGPIVCLDNIKKRTEMKVWPLLVCCLNTGSLAIYLSMSYSTSDFMIQFTQHIAVRGQPLSVYCDQGSQLIAARDVLKKQAAKTVTSEDSLPCKLDWTEIKSKTAAAGITWKAAPAGCQYRNGAVESMVRATKRSLTKVGSPFRSGGPVNLTYEEARTLMMKIASTINDRPLGVRHHGGAEGEFTPITPNLLLMGSRAENSGTSMFTEEETSSKLTKRLMYIETHYAQWWDSWFNDVFEHLVPRKAWRTATRNCRDDDIVLIKYLKKVGPADYKLGRITKAIPDPVDKLVRTVDVTFRKKNSREKPSSYPLDPELKRMETITVGVPRIVMMLPKEDQEQVETNTAS